MVGSPGLIAKLYLRFDVVRVLLRFGRHLHRVALADDADVTLEVTLRARRKVLRIGQQGPLVVELMIWVGRWRW